MQNDNLPPAKVPAASHTRAITLGNHLAFMLSGMMVLMAMHSLLRLALLIYNKEQIGGATGLDEAELARRHPLDGKPWDGPADGDEDSGVSDGDALLDEDDSVLSDEELEGDAPLDSGRDKRPGE